MKFFSSEPFDDQKIEAIRIQLTNLSASGKPTDYQIMLDDFEVVPRTSDVELFTSFYDLLSQRTQSLVITLFQGESRHKTNYSFYFQQQGQAQQGTLAGVDTQREIEQKVAFHALQFENKALQEKIKELNAITGELESEVEMYRKENHNLHEDLKKSTSENGIATSIIGGMERMFERFVPVANSQGQLAGTPQVGNSGKTQVAITMEEYDQFQSFAAMANKFEDPEFEKVILIIKTLSEQKELIDSTLDYLSND
jgi:hypothetical protein